MNAAAAPTADGLLEAAETRRLLETVLRLSPADETEAVLESSNAALTRFAHNVIHQNVSDRDLSLEVRAVFGRRVAGASTNDLTAGGLEQVVAEACRLAQFASDDADWPGLTTVAESRLASAARENAAPYDPRVAEMSAQARAQTVAVICETARSQGLLASGALATSAGAFALLNSHGLFAHAPATEINLSFVVEQPETRASAFGHACGWQLEQIDTDRLAEQTVRRSLSSRWPRPVPPGTYPVVLEPYAVASLLEALAEAGMGALAVQEERSWMNGRLGQPALSPLITITDDAHDPRGVPQAFDCEGVAKQRVAMVQDGVPLTPVYDRLTASREKDRRSTGHAQPSDDEDWDGPLPENLALEPGDSTVDDLIAGISRGLYITRFWYVNLLAAHDCTVTGTTRDGVWWIEDGRLAHPVENLRFDQSLVAALASVRGLGRERSTVAGYFGGTYRVPALALEHFRFIGP
ncbi:MAG: TldD/PmbA family protein [Anaerolineales bacterium]